MSQPAHSGTDQPADVWPPEDDQSTGSGRERPAERLPGEDAAPPERSEAGESADRPGAGEAADRGRGTPEPPD